MTQHTPHNSNERRSPLKCTLRVCNIDTHTVKVYNTLKHVSSEMYGEREHKTQLEVFN